MYICSFIITTAVPSTFTLWQNYCVIFEKTFFFTNCLYKNIGGSLQEAMFEVKYVVIISIATASTIRFYKVWRWNVSIIMGFFVRKWSISVALSYRFQNRLVEQWISSLTINLKLHNEFQALQWISSFTMNPSFTTNVPFANA